MAREARRPSDDASSGSISRTQAGPRICFGDCPHGSAGRGGVQPASRAQASVGVYARDRSERKETGLVQVQREVTRSFAAQTSGATTAAAGNCEASQPDHCCEIIATQACQPDDPGAGSRVEGGTGSESSQPDGI